MYIYTLIHMCLALAIVFLRLVAGSVQETQVANGVSGTFATCFCYFHKRCS